MDIFSPLENYIYEMYLDDSSGFDHEEDFSSVVLKSDSNGEEEAILNVEANPYLQRRFLRRRQQRRRLTTAALNGNDSPDLMAPQDVHADDETVPPIQRPQDDLYYGQPPFVHNEEYIPVHALLRAGKKNPRSPVYENEKSRRSTSSSPDFFMEKHHHPPPLAATREALTTATNHIVLSDYDMAHVGNLNESGHRLLVAPLVAVLITFVLWISLWLEKKRDTVHRQYLRRHKSNDDLLLDEETADHKKPEDFDYDEWGWLLNY